MAIPVDGGRPGLGQLGGGGDSDPRPSHPSLTIALTAPTGAAHQKGLPLSGAVANPTPYSPTPIPTAAPAGGAPVSLHPTGPATTSRGTIDSPPPTPPLIGEQLLIIAARNSRG